MYHRARDQDRPRSAAVVPPGRAAPARMGVGRSLGHHGIIPRYGKSGVPVVRCRPLGGRSGPPARPPEASWSDSSESLAGRQLANRVLRAGSDAGEEGVGSGDVSPAEFVRRLCGGSAGAMRRPYGRRAFRPVRLVAQTKRARLVACGRLGVRLVALRRARSTPAPCPPTGLGSRVKVPRAGLEPAQPGGH